MFLNAKIQSEGSPVLLIHGLFGSLDNLRGLAKTLSEQHKVYQIDLPNHGLSPHCDQLDYSTQASILKEFIKQQSLSELSIIGHSMGGKIAMMLALNDPLLVKKLIVIDIAPVQYQTGRHKAIFKAINACSNADILNRKDADKILSAYIDDLSVRQFLLKSLIKKENGHFSWQFNAKVLEEKYKDILDWQSTHVFKGDTLFIKGAESDYLLPEHRQEIEQQFPHAKFHVVAKAGHWVHAEKPENVMRAISRFLESSPSSK